MREERSRGVELKWWLSAFAALMAVLVVFSQINAVLSVITVHQSSLANKNLSDLFGSALDIAASWPIYVVLAFYPFLFAAALGFRLLVPTFAGAPPRSVAVVVVTWPIFLGSTLIAGDLLISVFFSLIAVSWALAMPLPKKTLLEEDPVKGAAIIGLAFAALLPVDGLLLAIAWCSWRLYKRHSLEAAITAVCAPIVPAVLIGFNLPSVSSSSRVVATWGVEILILGAIAVGGLILSRQPPHDEDGEQDDDSWDDDETQTDDPDTAPVEAAAR